MTRENTGVQHSTGRPFGTRLRHPLAGSRTGATGWR